MNVRIKIQHRFKWTALFLVGYALISGCGSKPLPATVEGTLRLDGKPLDNCLVIFYPEPQKDQPGKPRSTALTDQNGKFRLRCDDQREGVAVGWHRITVQDMSASTGVRRLDHGTNDMQPAAGPPPPARPSRVSKRYLLPEKSPLRKQVKPGHQVIDLDVD